MIKRFFIHLSVQFGVLVAAGTLVFLPVILFMCGIVGAAIGMVPDFTFNIMDGIICPEGTVDYFWSYQEHNTYDLHIDCVGSDGVHKDVLFPAMLLVCGGAFLIVFTGNFLPLLLLLATAAFFATRKVIAGQEAGAPTRPAVKYAQLCPSSAHK